MCHLAVLLISAGNLHLLYKTLKLSLPIVILLSECLATTAMPVAARLPSPSPLQPTARHATTVEVHGASCGAFCQHFGARTVKWPRIHLSVSARTQNGESLRCERMRGVKYPAEGSYTAHAQNACHSSGIKRWPRAESGCGNGLYRQILLRPSIFVSWAAEDGAHASMANTT